MLDGVCLLSSLLFGFSVFSVGSLSFVSSFV